MRGQREGPTAALRERRTQAREKELLALADVSAADLALETVTIGSSVMNLP